MDLINDLGNDLALAILVEKRHVQKIDSKDVKDLISRVRAILQPVSRNSRFASESNSSESSIPTISH